LYPAHSVCRPANGTRSVPDTLPVGLVGLGPPYRVLAVYSSSNRR